MPEPTAPAMTTLRMNFPGYEFSVFTELAERTGLTVDEAASRAIELFITDRTYRSQPGQPEPPDEAMVARSRALFPEMQPWMTIAPSTGDGEWTFVRVTMQPQYATYLNSYGTKLPRPNADGTPRLNFEGAPAGPGFDTTLFTVRSAVLEAVTVANRWMVHREFVANEPPVPPAVQPTAGREIA